MQLKILNKQNDENQDLYSQGQVLGKVFNKLTKKHKNAISTNKSHKNVITNLETISYGYAKTFNKNPSGTIKRQSTEPRMKKSQTASQLEIQEAKKNNQNLVDPAKKKPKRRNSNAIEGRSSRALSKRGNSVTKSHSNLKEIGNLQVDNTEKVLNTETKANENVKGKSTKKEKWIKHTDSKTNGSLSKTRKKHALSHKVLPKK